MALENLKIVSLEVENFKRISAVSIKPDGNVVQITGLNGQGKSSVLDAIWMAVDNADAKSEMPRPIRDGEKEARIQMDLGEIIIKRVFTAELDDDDNPTAEYTTKLYVEAASGARFPSPQKMLDSLFSALTFDPLDFARMKPKEQFDTLRQFVPDFDFEAFKRDHDADYARRTTINAYADQERGAAGVIVVPKDTPQELVDIDALVERINEAGAANLDRERRINNRREAATTIENMRKLISTTTEQVGETIKEYIASVDKIVAGFEADIAALREKIQKAQENRAEHVTQIQQQHAAWVIAKRKEADELEERLKAADPLPDFIETDSILAEIEQARQININVQKFIDKRVHEVQARRHEEEAKKLTEQINKRIEAKNAAIAASTIPVEGLGFGDDQILLRGVPFCQGSDAERLRASVQIAIAMNPKLRVIRIRDGSLLDENGMKLLYEMADAANMQIWIERVDSSGTIGFVIEDGRLKDAAK